MKIFLTSILFFISFIAFDCEETPVIIQSVCEITKEICEYSQAICDMIPHTNSLEKQNTNLKMNLKSYSNALELHMINLNSDLSNFSNEDLLQLKLDLVKIRDDLRKQYYQLKKDK